MPYLTIRFVDGAVLSERQGTPPADGRGLIHKLFSDVIWTVDLVGENPTDATKLAIDPAKFTDGGYSSGWLKIPITDAHYDAIGNTIHAANAMQKTTATLNNRLATRTRLKAARKANISAVDLAAAILARTSVTRANIESEVDSSVDAIPDRDIDKQG